MNTEEKEKIEAIYVEARRIRILFGISIVIISLILAVLAPIVIYNRLTISALEDAWGIPHYYKGNSPINVQENNGVVQYAGTSTQKALPLVDKKQASTTPYAQ